VGIKAADYCRNRVVRRPCLITISCRNRTAFPCLPPFESVNVFTHQSALARTWALHKSPPDRTGPVFVLYRFQLQREGVVSERSSSAPDAFVGEVKKTSACLSPYWCLSGVGLSQAPWSLPRRDEVFCLPGCSISARVWASLSFRVEAFFKSLRSKLLPSPY